MKVNPVCVYVPLVVLLPLVIYFYTLCPTVYWGDCGEFLTAAYQLGIPHSPGHPFYPIIGKAFSLVPIAPISFRINFTSAFFTALASGLVFGIVLKLQSLIYDNKTKQYLPAMCTALVFAFSHATWKYALQAEVYALMNFFTVSLVYFAITYAEKIKLHNNKDAIKWVYLFSFVYGLAITNNINILLLAPVFMLFFLMINSSELLKLKIILVTVLFFALGISLYFYLPIRSLHNPPIDWGDPQTPQQFLWLIMLKDFAGNLLSLEYSVEGGIPGFIHRYKEILSAQFTLLCTIFSILGVVVIGYRWYRCSKVVRDYNTHDNTQVVPYYRVRFIGAFLLFTVFIFCVTLCYSFCFGEGLQLDAYLLPTFFILTIWLAATLLEISNRLDKQHKTFSQSIDISARKSQVSRKNYHQLVKSCVFKPQIILIVLLFILVVPNLAKYSVVDQSDNFTNFYYGRSILALCEQGSILITENTEDVFPPMYLQHVEGYRKDVTIVYSPLLVYRWYRDQLKKSNPLLHIRPTISPVKYQTVLDFIDDNIHTHPIYYTPGTKILVDTERCIPWGLIFKLSADKTEINTHTLNTHYRLQKVNDYSNQITYSYSRPAIERYTILHSHFGEYFYSRGEITDMIWEYQRALQLSPGNEKVYYNLGIAYKHTGRYNKAIEQFHHAIKVSPEFIQAYYQLAIVYQLQRKFDDAIKHFKYVINHVPNHIQAHYNLALCYYENRLFSLAVEHNLKAIELRPDFVQAYVNTGVCYRGMNRIPQAIEMFNKAIQIKPTYKETYYNLGSLFIQMGELDKAATVFNSAIRLIPDDPYLWLGLAKIERLRNNLLQADYYTSQAKKLQKN